MWKWSPSWEQWYRRVLPAYWIFLFCATHLPRPKLVVVSSDKRVHVIVFGALAFLFWKFAESYARPPSGRFVWVALLAVGIYAALDEYLQQFVNRTTCWEDLLANWLGVALMLATLETLRRVRGQGGMSALKGHGQASNP
jgi:VanZ family protein